MAFLIRIHLYFILMKHTGPFVSKIIKEKFHAVLVGSSFQHSSWKICLFSSNLKETVEKTVQMKFVLCSQVCCLQIFMLIKSFYNVPSSQAPFCFKKKMFPIYSNQCLHTQTTQRTSGFISDCTKHQFNVTLCFLVKQQLCFMKEHIITAAMSIHRNNHLLVFYSIKIENYLRENTFISCGVQIVHTQNVVI